MTYLPDPAVTTGRSASATGHRVAVMYGLWRDEWLAYGRLITDLTALWLIGIFILELFYHPGFMLGFGVLYALIIGTVCGGAEAMAGTEEFTFALPATRSQRYLARLALGGGVLVVMQIIGLVAIASDLPQVLWGLVADSGFTEPFPRVDARFLYLLAAAFPFATFAIIFAFTAGTNGGGTATLPAWLTGLSVTGMITALGFIAESATWGHLNGYVSCPALLVLTALVLWIGRDDYMRKEVLSRGSHGRLWALVIVMLLIEMLLIVLWIKPTVPFRSPKSEVRELPGRLRQQEGQRVLVPPDPVGDSPRVAPRPADGITP
jgi:hypothetical protein